jgi:hypothetical protein
MKSTGYGMSNHSETSSQRLRRGRRRRSRPITRLRSDARPFRRSFVPTGGVEKNYQVDALGPRRGLSVLDLQFFRLRKCQKEQETENIFLATSSARE